MVVAHTAVSAVSPTASRRGRGWRKGVISPRALWRVGNPRYSAARPSRNQIVLVLVLVLDCPVSDYEDDDEDEDEKFARPATIRTDTDRLGSLCYGSVRLGRSADSRVCRIADCQSARARRAQGRCFARDYGRGATHPVSVHRRDQIVVVLVLVLDWPDYEDEDEDALPPEPPVTDACPTLNTYPMEERVFPCGPAALRPFIVQEFTRPAKTFMDSGTN